MKDAANAIRFLSIDAVQQAKSGHPGMPMGMADIATVLWKKFLKHSPLNPQWANRDRFILSNGHGSMLLYSLLHLSGYDLSLEQIKNFRQLESQTPGHPEFGDTPGVETTTGPLGQGLANAVGMAIAEKTLAAQFNQPNYDIVDHYTYAFVGDGCLMEGISHEACSLAGTLNLNKLIVFYDDNQISIDGNVDGWFTDDTPKRFEAYGWHVIPKVDGHDFDAIEQAIINAQASDKPTLICCQTTIGYGSPKFAGSEKSHGSPLGSEEIAATRQALNWPHPAFSIPEEIREDWNNQQCGQQQDEAWQQLLVDYQTNHPKLYAEFFRRVNKQLPIDWSGSEFIQTSVTEAQTIASRKASQNCLEAYGSALPELFGGSADLAGSNNTIWSGSKAISAESFNGNYLHYGVREFGMAAIMNGLALHGGFIPYGGTFLVFSDYARNAIRLSAMMKQQVIYVLTHDSIGLGEDGPTHQPIEHAAMLRLTPNLMVWRPADATETAVAWQQSLLKSDAPSCLLLSRQNLPALPHKNIADIQKGGYILHEPSGSLDGIFIATGSEVQLALEASHQLSQQGKNWRVVSMPCTEAFDSQESSYQEHVLPKSQRARIAIEAASSDYWSKYVGLDGEVIGLSTFGVSAPAATAYQHFEITVENIVKTAVTLN